MKGALQDVLDEISYLSIENSATAYVYVRQTGPITVYNTPARLFESGKIVLLPDPDQFDSRQYVVTWHLTQDETKGMPPIVVEVKLRSEATPAPTPTPAIKIGVKEENYAPQAYTNVAPTFTLSGIAEGSEAYVYGVFINDERLVKLQKGENTYIPQDEGELRFCFLVLDTVMEDMVARSEYYAAKLDRTPPDTPWLEPGWDEETELVIVSSDAVSGMDAYSTDGGQTFTPWPEGDEMPVMSGEAGDSVNPGDVQVRDKAGNIARNEEEFIFGEYAIDIPSGGGGGSGSGDKPIKHVKETMDYSKANYNALELEFADGPQTELKAGEEVLALSLAGGGGESAQPFTAAMQTWKRYEGDAPKAANALVLTAYEPAAMPGAAVAAAEGEQTADGQDVAVWRFTGDVYRLLYNSGVDFLVLQSGTYMTAIPTEGFTAGTQYAKLKASGVSTRKFDYTVSQDEALRETTISVAVGEDTWLLEEDKSKPMYRYNVLIGTADMMKKPFESYIPKAESDLEEDNR